MQIQCTIHAPRVCCTNDERGGGVCMRQGKGGTLPMSNTTNRRFRSSTRGRAVLTARKSKLSNDDKTPAGDVKPPRRAGNKPSRGERCDDAAEHIGDKKRTPTREKANCDLGEYMICSRGHPSCYCTSLSRKLTGVTTISAPCPAPAADDAPLARHCSRCAPPPALVVMLLLLPQDDAGRPTKRGSFEERALQL